MQQRYITRISREDIYKGEYLRALVQISTDLESLFFDKLFFEKGLNPDLIENWTLGKLTEWVIKNKLVDEKYFEVLSDFRLVRNALVHQRYGMHNTSRDLEKLNFLANLMIKVCDFIDETFVERKTDFDFENKYSKIFSKTKEKYEKAFKKSKT